MTRHATELHYRRAERTLEVAFDDGARFVLPAEYLRVESPSAELKGHGTATRTIIGGCRAVGIARIEPVGNYAAQLVFDDGHDSGLFSWEYLYELGRDQPARWAAYLEVLAARGLSRER